MQDKLIISINFKKTFAYIEKCVTNYPHKELILKQRTIDVCYEILESIYRANIYKESFYMKEILVKLRMLEFYIKDAFEKKLINFTKFENIGNYLLDITKMINVWIKNEKSK